MEEQKIKRWFITDKKEIRYIHTVLKKDDEAAVLFVVSMANNYNCPCYANTKLEYANYSNCFESLKECQFEIIRRERFEK